MSIELQIAAIIAYVAVGIPYSIYLARNNEQVSPCTWTIAVLLWPLIVAFNFLIWFVQTEFKNPFYRE